MVIHMKRIKKVTLIYRKAGVITRKVPVTIVGRRSA